MAAALPPAAAQQAPPGAQRQRALMAQQRPQAPAGAHRHLQPPSGPGRPQPPQQQQQQQRQAHGRPPGGGSSRPGGSGRPSGHRAAAHAGSSGRPGGGGAPAGAAATASLPAIAADNSAELEHLRRNTNLKCNIRFRNDLPEIPSDPKLVATSFEPQRLSRFFVTSIEQQPRRELLLPADVGVPISLLDLERYDVPADAQHRARRLDPADEALLQDVEGLPTGVAGAASPLKVKRATKGAVVPWLMATTYLTSGDAGPKRGGNRFQMGSSQQAEELTREQQLADIEATFVAAREAPVQHPTKPGVTAVRCLPLLPDLDAWPNKYVTVVFEEGDPAHDSKAIGKVKDVELRKQLLANSMLKSYQPQGSDRDPAMGLLVPMTGAAAASAGQPVPHSLEPEDVQGDHSWECEYSFDLQQHAPDQPLGQVLLVMRDDADARGYLGYSRLDGHLKLRKRKRQDGDEPRPQKAVVYARPYSEGELMERLERLEHVDYYGAGEEEQEDGEGEEGGGAAGGGDGAAAAAAQEQEEAIFGDGGGAMMDGDGEEEAAQGGLGYQ